MLLSFFSIALPSFFFYFIYGLHKSILSSKITYKCYSKSQNKLWNLWKYKISGCYKVWNDISDDIKLLPLKIFKKNLKLILLEKY